METLKIRASYTGYLMSSPKRKSNRQKYDETKKILEAKVVRLDGLSNKAIKTRDKLSEEIPELETQLKLLEPIKDKVELSATAKEFLQRLYWETEHGIKEEYTSKYFDKGNDAEDLSISLAQKVNGWKTIEKNIEGFENEYITGTPDLIYNDLIADTKTSWTAFSYPLFETELKETRYYWQIMSYLALTGRPRGVVSYCLVDTPELLVTDEIYKYARINGLIDTPAQAELEIRHAHNYSRLPEKMRVKNFYIERDAEAIELLYKRIEVAREYYAELLDVEKWLTIQHPKQ